MMLEPLFSPQSATQREELISTWFPIIVEKMCHAPADIFGIKERGYLRNGYHADLVIVEPGETRITRESLLYKCGWSPLEGETLHSRIRQVFLNGMPSEQSTPQPLVFGEL